MAGRVIRVFPLTALNFDNLATSSSITVVLTERIDVSLFREIDLLVRFHTGATLPTGATAVVKALVDGFTPDDPATDFATASAVASVSVQASTTFPYFGVAAATSAFGSMVRVVLVVTKAGTAGNLSFPLSVDLAGKEGA